MINQIRSTETINLNQPSERCKLTGKILVADDKAINLEALKLNLQDINLYDRSEFFYNG